MSDQNPRNDRPVMGDHPDLEPEDEVQRREPVQASGNSMARMLVPGIIVLVIVLIIIALFIL